MQWLSRFRTHRFAKYIAIALATLLLVSLIALLWGRSSRSSNPDPIHLAIAAPVTGLPNNAGQEMIQSAQLYLDSVNRQGGIKGHPLKLLVFDDKVDPKVAQEIPPQVKNSPALVVLGHLGGSTSAAAAPLYNTLQIPVITGTANEDSITQANPYYFRTVFTSSAEVSVVALYMQRALNLKTASIIYTDDRRGRAMNEAFETTFRREGTVKHAWKFNPKSPNVASEINLIVNELAADANSGIVYLAVGTGDAKKFVVAIRLRGLKTPLFGSQGLVRVSSELAEEYEEEKRQPGYFLDGTYVTSSLIFDSAGLDAQEFASNYQKAYGDLPSYVGAAYYDTARLAVRAIQEAEIENTSVSRGTDRKKIRDQLELINNRKVALKGLNGPIYFDATHDNTSPVRVLQVVGQNLISAPVQFSPIADLSGVDLDQEVEVGNILRLNYKSQDQYFWRQEVVYTGIDINKISRLDQNQSSFTADFYLWMRYVGNNASNVDPTNIQFPNGIANSLNQNLPLFDPKSPIRSEMIGELNYRLYQIQGEFKGSYDFHDYPFDRQKLKIYFQNTQIPSDRLIYAIDTFGLKLPGVTKDQQRRPYQSLQLWQFNDLQYAQETFSSNSTKGDPQIFNSNLRIDYPGLSSTITLQRRFSVFLIKTLLPLGVLTLVLYSTLFFSENQPNQRLGVAISVLLSSAVLLTAINTQLSDTGYTVAIEYGFYIFFGLCLFCILFGITVERLRQAGRKTALIYLDYAARFIYVLIVVATVTSYAVMFADRL